ncbi:MAG: ABC transporter ATP-binding protein [Francisellaceae bacterium]
MLKIKNLNLKNRLHNITLDFHPQKHYAIIGPNGAGKSSLLSTIAGLIRSSQYTGSIQLNSEEISRISTKKRAQKIALLSQTISVGFDYRAKDIIAMGTYACQLQKQVIDSKINELSDALELNDLIDLPYDKLSGGQQRRVQLARVLLQLTADKTENRDECWLLLDEHSAGLDLYYQYESFNYIQKICSDHHIGIISILHDIPLVAKFADEVILLRGGSVISQGNPHMVLLSQSFYDCFKAVTKYIQEEDSFIIKWEDKEN